MNKSVRISARGPLPARTIVSTSVLALLLWLFVSISVPQFENYQLKTALLRAEAKCPGLPYGQYSGGPDYINIAIDIALLSVAAVFIYLTVRDIRRKRRMDSEESDSLEEVEEEDSEL